jgi:hypothetical protein
MPKLKAGKQYVKGFGSCKEALNFIESLLTKKNKSGRLQSKRRGNLLEWDWSVRYIGKEKE